MRSTCGEVRLILTDDLPAPLWQPDERTAAVSINEVVSDTLDSLFLYTKSQLEAIQISLPDNTYKLSKPARECEEQFKVFFFYTCWTKLEFESRLNQKKICKERMANKFVRTFTKYAKIFLRSEDLIQTLFREYKTMFMHYIAICLP